MNVPAHDNLGLRVHREAMRRQTSAITAWEKTYGKDAVPHVWKNDTNLFNLAYLDRTKCMPMSLNKQLLETKKARMDLVTTKRKDEMQHTYLELCLSARKPMFMPEVSLGHGSFSRFNHNDHSFSKQPIGAHHRRFASNARYLKSRPASAFY